ncbi:MAG TPA: class IV adenylate cyclase [Tepidisphaeraceae bacterium]|nr:class IV adenylate cyclase [Tepidisphaeraceae bacterium]
MATELEAKMKVDDLDAVRRRLAECGAKRTGSALETNMFFDTPERTLVSADKGLRLRRKRDDQTGKEKFIITVKGPQQQGDLKNREEAEAGVQDGDDATAVLAALGYYPTLSFQKKRESWELDGCKIELDEIPILGRFVEIEGPDDRTVIRVREKLQLSDRPLIKTGYITMLARHLKETHDDRREVTF